MKKQMYPIKKDDWLLTIQPEDSNDIYDQKQWVAPTKAALVKDLNLFVVPGDRVQIFKVNFEFRDSFVYGKPDKEKSVKRKKCK